MLDNLFQPMHLLVTFVVGLFVLVPRSCLN